MYIILSKQLKIFSKWNGDNGQTERLFLYIKLGLGLFPSKSKFAWVPLNVTETSAAS